MAEGIVETELDLAKFSLDMMESELQCSICTELFIKAITLNCSHTFCKYCISKWKQSKSVCPICRIQIINECPTLVLDTYIDKVLGTCSPEIQKKRLDIISKRDKYEAVNPITPTAALSNRRWPINSMEMGNLSAFILDLEHDDYDDYYDEDYDDDYLEESDYSDEDAASEASNDEVENENGENENSGAEEEEAETGSSSSEEEEELSYASNYNFEEEEEDITAEVVPYNGIAGAYYGGYGSCFKCGRTGHWSNGCPQRTDVRCFKCGEPGHMRKACPNSYIQWD